VSFASEPGRDDSGLPPVNIEIPDDARELARDVLAYHREQRARRRRARLLRVLSPLARLGFIRHGTIFPLIATCVAASMLAAAMLSVVTISPASAPTVDKSPSASTSASASGARTPLPDDAVKLGAGFVAARSLTRSLLVLISPACGQSPGTECGTTLASLATQAAAARVGVYFVYSAGTTDGLPQQTALTARYGDGVAQTVYDITGTLFSAFPVLRVTALLVRGDATVDVRQAFRPGFDLTPALRGLSATH
jgi:hypothetical protein